MSTIYSLFEANCSCRTHLVDPFIYIGKCGECGETPFVDWVKGPVEEYEID